MVHEPNVPYFTCTLGQAASLNHDLPVLTNINDFIDKQARTIPDRPAVGFADLQEKDGSISKSQIFTFQDIQRGVYHVSQFAAKSSTAAAFAPQTVALLCSSTAEFVFTWLGLIRLGHAVLLIAPQCQPSAIVHLCKTCHVNTLFYDDIYTDLAQNSSNAAERYDLKCVPLTFDTKSREFLSVLERDTVEIPSFPEMPSTSVAYLHHTSGTSTGLPKPIPQSHKAAIGVLPQLSDGSDRATFTTTPLYHGGVADLFRAWTSNAMIWLFPGKGFPITAKNIIACLDVAGSDVDLRQTPPVKYFSSVPYVLQMMASEIRGLEYLKNMDIVGVGGAALPAEVGGELVAKGVNLISRFGSAECGFLMSSHRDYKLDKEWQYLRAASGAEALRFEDQGDETSELVVLESWPHRAKTNRDDGSFATADLFAPHAFIPKAWKYHSRADSQLTLITGKKFDPAPLESSIATSKLLDDVLVFGNGRPFPGALLFVSSSAATMSKDDIISALALSIEKLNSQSADHARLARNMLVVLPYGDNKLQKSSKGTILRNKAEEIYRGAIEKAYDGLKTFLTDDVEDEDVAETIGKNIEAIIGSGKGSGQLQYDTELFSYGVDSVASIQIRYTLARLLPPDFGELPLSIVEDCGTVAKLADFVKKTRRGELYDDEENEIQLMQDLVDEYGDFHNLPQIDPGNDINTKKEDEKRDRGDVVILTGATGALGAHLLHIYRSSVNVSQIYCLVRGADEHAAWQRVDKSLFQRGLPGLSTSSASKITVLPCKLSDSHLGLDSKTYTTLATHATIIAHLAWTVNFRPRLRSFVKDHIAGLRHLLCLSLLSPGERKPIFAFCSSVASVAEYHGDVSVPEELSLDPQDAGPLGYSRSKWVAEALCSRATKAHSQANDSQSSSRGSVAVFRVGQLSGAYDSGIWNSKEAYPLLLGSVKATGCLPLLNDEVLSWLPVDVAARAMFEAIQSMQVKERRKEATVEVYHILNTSGSPTWSTLLTWLSRTHAFKTVDPKTWIGRLEELQKTRPDYPALKLLGLWRGAYAVSEGDYNSDREQLGKVVKTFETKQAKRVSETMNSVTELDEEYVLRLWKWILETTES